MADGIFANTAFEGSIAPSVAVQNPVSNDAVSSLLGSVSDGIKQAGAFFKAGAAADASAANSQVLSNYQKEISVVADGVEQGMPVSQARMLVRNISNKYTSNYPSLIKDINTTTNQILGSSGIANVITTGNAQTEAEDKMRQKAFADGWPDIHSYQAHLATVNQAAALDAQLKIKVDQYGLVNQDDKVAGYNALKGIVQTGLPWINNRVSYYQQLIDSGKMSQQDAVANLQAEVSKETAFIGQARGLSGGADKDIDPSFLLTGIQDRVKAFTDYNNGSITKDVLTNRLANDQAQDQLMIRASDPTLAKMISLSNMLPPVAASPLIDKISQKGIELFANIEQGGLTPTFNPVTGAANSLPKPVDIIDSSTDVNGALQVAKESIKTIGAKPTPDQKTSIDNSLKNILSSVVRFGGTAGNPTDFNSVVDFWGDPAVGAYVAKNGLPKGTGDDASYTLEQEYGNVLLPIIRSEWDDAKVLVQKSTDAIIAKLPPEQQAGAKQVFSGGTTPVLSDIPSAVQAVWNGSAVEFKAYPGYENDVQVRNAVNKLNDLPAKTLNTYIRAAAHMQGSVDYKSYFDANIKDRLFGDQPNSFKDGKGNLDKFSDGFDAVKPTTKAAVDQITGNAPANAPAGMRNNNPGNIKFSSRINWQGQVGPSKNTDQGDPQVVFATQQDGIRAMAKLAVRKYNQGFDTIRKLIADKNGWTPGYTPGAVGVAKAAGIGIDDHINLNDPDTLSKVLRGIVTQEHGPASKFYTDSMLQQGAVAALS